MPRQPKKGDIVRFIENRWICAGEYTYQTTSEFEVMANDTGLVLDVVNIPDLPRPQQWLVVLINGQVGHFSISNKSWPVRVIS